MVHEQIDISVKKALSFTFLREILDKFKIYLVMYASVCRNMAVSYMFDRLIHTTVYNKKLFASQYDLEYKTIKNFYNFKE